MDFEASFEAKLQEHLRAVSLAADEAKEHVRLGVALLAPTPVADEPVPEPPRPRAAVSFDDFADPAIPGVEVDAAGIPVWEDPP